jgi:RimJ/RimL family protein N-acetyltransferase
VQPHIRPYAAADWPQLWPILHHAIAAGETYAFDPASTQAQMHAAWIESPSATFVACAADGAIVGTYFIKPNQPGLGAHVCNCGYIVAPAAQGQGIAAAMCQHSQQEALRSGFLAMQFNLVVSTNTRAVALWQRMEFTIVGTLPHAFRHQTLGFVDAHVMFKQLAQTMQD